MSDQIVMLKGPDRVRLRPAVMFGSDDITGVMSAVEMLLDFFIEEAKNGFCSQITITQCWDGSICLEDNGRGIYFGLDDTIWQELFCRFYQFSSPDTLSAQRSIFEEPRTDHTEVINDFQLYAVQCASEYMDVEVVRDGKQYNLHFEKGENIGGLSTSPCTIGHGTCIRFKPDATVFSNIALPSQWIADKAREIAFLVPGIKTVFDKEGMQGSEVTAFVYPNGAVDYLKEQLRGCDASEIYTVELEAEGQERYNKPRYKASVKIGVCFTKEPGKIQCYHNHCELSYGGTHLQAVVGKITKYLQWTLEKNISEEEVLSHLRLLIITNSELTSGGNGARNSIDSLFIKDLSSDAIGDDFRYYLKQNQACIASLFDNVARKED